MTEKTTHDGDVDFIRALAELLRANDLTELEVKREYGDNDRLNVRVSRLTQMPAQMMAPQMIAPQAVSSPAATQRRTGRTRPDHGSCEPARGSHLADGRHRLPAG
jgi:acetyl-CoA carboxylase biotin carboxyl carrier protein